ncbi:MAG: hypothetical protein ACKOFK_11345, partial [Betaproteobacteria bacterium]
VCPAASGAPTRSGAIYSASEQPTRAARVTAHDAKRPTRLWRGGTLEGARPGCVDCGFTPPAPPLAAAPA